MMYYFSPRHWKEYENCYVTTSPAHKAVGLGIHPVKTKILSNQYKLKSKEIAVDNIKIDP